jgi:hypothetical protein
MRIPPVVLIIAPVILALPFGWGLGVIIAYLIAEPNFGQLPIVTVPLAIAASIVFALVPWLPAQTRVIIMAIGTAAFVVLGHLVS